MPVKNALESINLANLLGWQQYYLDGKDYNVWVWGRGNRMHCTLNTMVADSAWNPFNKTEDCDMLIDEMSRKGFRMFSATNSEAWYEMFIREGDGFEITKDMMVQEYRVNGANSTVGVSPNRRDAICRAAIKCLQSHQC